MKPTKRSIWPARIEAGWTPPLGGGRPRGMPQWLWFWISRRSFDPRLGRWPHDGWGGGRDLHKPHVTSLHLHERGEWLGGVMGYEVQPMCCVAYVNLPDGGQVERVFGRRRDAKRWVEAHPRRVRG